MATNTAQTARINSLVPVFGIDSYQAAREHYVDLLGFKLDWEWRAGPGEPVIMSVSRDDVCIMLNEDASVAAGAWLTLKVDNLEQLAGEWNSRQAGSAIVEVDAPYDIPTVSLSDPFGNRMDFQQPISAAEEQARVIRAGQMRQRVRECIDRGEPRPTPEQLVEAFGPPLGVAMAVLGEFQD